MVKGEGGKGYLSLVHAVTWQTSGRNCCYMLILSGLAHPQLPQTGPALLCFLGGMQVDI